MNVSDLKTLIGDLQATTISHLEIDSEGLKVKIDWQRTGSPQVSPGGLTVVRAPVAGTFRPLVEVGAGVEVGMVLCSLEREGVVNEIESESSGRILVIHGASGEAVKEGDTLMEILGATGPQAEKFAVTAGRPELRRRSFLTLGRS